MLNLGIIGLGGMGRIHAQNVIAKAPATRLASVYDPDERSSQLIANSSGASVSKTAEALISDDSVDAILIASPASFHWQQVRTALNLGKPVFVEKPLVYSSADQHEVLKLLGTPAERLVWVGFMRRFDPAFLGMKSSIDKGEIGSVTYIEMSHRNPSVPALFDDYSYMLETFIHECDAASWLVNEPITHVQIDAVGPLALGTNLHDPLFATLTTESGIFVRLAGHINNGYGYQIRCEAVGSMGELRLDDSLWNLGDGSAGPSAQAADWGTRFADAYSNVLTGWIRDIETSSHSGVTLREGLQASKTAWALAEALKQPGVPKDVR